MNKRVIFFDGDGTLWYPPTTRRTCQPFWIYTDELTKEAYLDHLVLTPHVVETLQEIRRRGISTVVLSTHPHEAPVAATVLKDKIQHFQLAELFDELHATAEYPEAKAETMQEILKRRGLSAQEALMVGDSYRWDYAPAQSVGVDAVLLDSAYHQEKRAEEPVERIVTELNELLGLLGGSS